VPVVTIGGDEAAVPSPYSPRELFEALTMALAGTGDRAVAAR
jgi:hypothetical protein